MKLFDKIASKIKTPALKRLFIDDALRAKVLFVFSILVGFAFGCFNAVSAIIYKSSWYGAIAGYYFMLVIQKGSVAIIATKLHRKCINNASKWIVEQTKIYLANGVVLLVLSAVLSGFMIEVTDIEKPVKTNIIFAIANATFAFYKITSAIINFCKAKKGDDMILKVIRNIGFISAIVSLLTLTSTMLTTFGNIKQFKGLLVAECVVCGISILTFGIYMIDKGAKLLASYKKNPPIIPADDIPNAEMQTEDEQIDAVEDGEQQ